MSDKELISLVESTAHKLGEHFDAVEILASWTSNSSTYCVKRGVGNWYARQGMAHEFVLEEETSIQEETARRIEDSDDENSNSE